MPDPDEAAGIARASRGAGLRASAREHHAALTSLRQTMEAARTRCAWAVVGQLSQFLNAHDETASGESYLRLAQACWQLRDVDAADAAARCALAVDPSLVDACVLQAWVAAERGDAATAIACYRRLIELNPDTARWVLKLVQLLNWQGFVEEAVDVLRKAVARWPADPSVTLFMENSGLAAAVHVDAAEPEDVELQRLADAAPEARHRRRHLLDNDPRSDVLTAVAGTDSAVLIFTGSNDGIAMPLRIFDAYMAVLPITCIYVKDFRRLRYLRGIRSLGGDYASTVAALRKTLHDLGVKHLCTLGNCDGGVGAIRFGVDLGAERILAFETPTHLPSEDGMRFEQGRNFKRRRLNEEVPAEFSDLQRFLACRHYSSRIDVYYAQDNQRDRLHAAHLEGLPGVALRPQPGSRGQFLLRGIAASSDDFSVTAARWFGLTH
jgi:tetratricopeptide (TPR) repeat protein